MKTDLRMYGNEFNPSIVKDINDINKKIEKETDSEELLKLRLQRLYRGMEINTSIYNRNPRCYYPY
jgi:hypothetical protein